MSITNPFIKCKVDADCAKFVVPPTGKGSTGTCCAAFQIKDIGNLDDSDQAPYKILYAAYGFPVKAGDTGKICAYYGGVPQVTPAGQAPGPTTTWSWVCDGGASTLMAGIAGVTAYVSLM